MRETQPVQQGRERGVITGLKIDKIRLYMLLSPAHPNPRLASVTPSCVTESKRAGFASKLSAACAPT